MKKILFKHFKQKVMPVCAGLILWGISPSQAQAPAKTVDRDDAAASSGKRSSVQGLVVDEREETVPGASITVKGTPRGVTTDTDGTFVIDVSPSDVLEISFLGYETFSVPVGKQTYISVKLEPKKNELDEVTIVGFGRQKKESVVSSIQTVNTKDLIVPSSNLTTAFAGRIAGMISFQTSGEPGHDDASFFIRGVTSFGTGKVDPLILVDNVEVTTSDLSNLHPDDLASFSILKDATATAVYGARGANGVILITTKEGKEGKPQVSVRVESAFSNATDKIEMADPITYMRMANEAATTRDPLQPVIYSNSKIENTIQGTNPYAYPQVDWMNMLIKDVASSQRVNLNISGGGKVARYYIAGSFTQDNGILRVDKRNSFNNNVNYRKYLLHSNINLNITGSTEAVIRLHGTFNDYQGPIPGGSELYKRILTVSPVRFPAAYEPDVDPAYRRVRHVLFGGDPTGNYYNPYADMLRGYQQNSNSTMMAQVEFKQDFGQWVEGLSGRLLGNTSRYAAFDQQLAYSPFYYISEYDRVENTYALTELNPETGTEYLTYTSGKNSINYSLYGEASLNYSRTFNSRHNVSGMLVAIVREQLSANANTLANSLPARNLGLSGRFTYGFDQRYFAEFNFGYNGSEKFDTGNRWGFFPSLGIGWMISNEKFWLSSNITDYVSKLKLRGTYGLVGNDAIGSTRFFYISEVYPNGGGFFVTGNNFDERHYGYRIARMANPNIGWEISKKTNLGIELGLLDGKIEVLADIFREHRSNILMTRANIPKSQGFWDYPMVNIGEADGSGIDLSVDYKHTIGRNWWLVGRGNFTYAHSTYAYYEEVSWDELGAPGRAHAGLPVSQKWGYVAERLFMDEEDIANSARQEFGEYKPGDIKYRDINKDNYINELDMVPIGYPATPEINYGFGLSVGYRNFDLSFFLSGSARSSFFIDPSAMTPFVQRTVEGKITEGGLSKFIADNYWTDTEQNPYAGWPRLSTTVVDNNVQPSTWWLYDGDYLRLKSVELGYSLPEKLYSKARLASLRIYFSGTNLALFSKFKLWDIELGNNGLNYPLQRVMSLI
jgi:TonB-linked SusC/RagA family outer membrane protein